MKLKNKKTGEIGNLGYLIAKNGFSTHIFVNDKNGVQLGEYSSLASLNKEWEDYDYTEERWCISYTGKPYQYKHYVVGEYTELCKAIGKYFKPEEEAELALRRIKAWKRLKDKGFRYILTPRVGSLDVDSGKFQIDTLADMPSRWFCCDAVHKDLDLLFGGEDV